MAHPLGLTVEEREKNRANAIQWFAWLHDQFPDIVFTANWIAYSAGKPDVPDEHALAIDMVHVGRSDLIFFVGGGLSPGMLREQEHAFKHGIHGVDLTFLGYSPPMPAIESDPITGLVREIESAYFRELNKALARIAPLDGELREAFNKELAERLSVQAMGTALSFMGRAREHEIEMRTGHAPTGPELWPKKAKPGQAP